MELSSTDISNPMQFDLIGSGNGLAPNRQQAIIWTNIQQISMIQNTVLWCVPLVVQLNSFDVASKCDDVIKW